MWSLEWVYKRLDNQYSVSILQVSLKSAFRWLVSVSVLGVLSRFDGVLSRQAVLFSSEV